MPVWLPAVDGQVKNITLYISVLCDGEGAVGAREVAGQENQQKAFTDIDLL